MFKDWLIDKMSRSGTKVVHFCQEAGISRGMYYKYLNGISLPDEKSLKKYIKIFNAEYLPEYKAFTRERGWKKGRSREKSLHRVV